MTTAKANYKASVDGSRISMSTLELPLEIHQMIVWCMHHEADAMYLLPAYRELRQQVTERDEGQKTHFGSDI